MDSILENIAVLSDREALEAVKNLLILYKASGDIRARDMSEDVMKRLLIDANVEEELSRKLIDEKADGNGGIARSALYIASFDQGRRELLDQSLVLAKGSGRAEPLSLLIVVGLIYVVSRIIPESVVVKSANEESTTSTEVHVRFPKQSLQDLAKLFKKVSHLQE